GWRSARPGATVVDPDLRSNAQPVQVVLGDHRGAAVAHADMHVVSGVLDPVLDRVAGERARDGTGGGRRIAAAGALVVGQLATGRGAYQAADHGARRLRRIAAGDLLDARHGAAVHAVGGGRAGRVAAAGVTRVVAGGRATGEGQAGRGGDADEAGADHVHVRLLLEGGRWPPSGHAAHARSAAVNAPSSGAGTVQVRKSRWQARQLSPTEEAASFSASQPAGGFASAWSRRARMPAAWSAKRLSSARPGKAGSRSLASVRRACRCGSESVTSHRLPLSLPAIWAECACSRCIVAMG